MKPTISIIGGYGGMGRLFSKLFIDEGLKVIVSGPTESKGVKAEKELGVVYEKDNNKAAECGDVVIITVPIEYTPETIKEVAPHVKKGSLLMDFTSIKEEPCRLMQECAKPGVEVIGTHPVFGPRLSSIEGQVFVITNVSGKKWLKWLKEFLDRQRAKVIETTPREHDETMAVVQGLTHFAYIAIGKTLEEMDFDIKESRRFSSPIYELMLNLIGRIIGQDPHLYASIQMENPRVLDVHRVFLKTAENLSKVVKKGDEKEFVGIMSRAAKHFDDVDYAMGMSDKAIASLVNGLQDLKDLSGAEVSLRHIYSGQVHTGIIRKVTAENVIIDEFGKESELKLSNVQILPDGQRLKNKADKFGTVSRDFSVILNDGADEGFITGLVSARDNVTSVEIKDVYKGGKIGSDKKSVCFRVTMVNHRPRETEGQIADFFRKIGGVLR
ncbi:MAG: hypothetical protein MSIBF_01370 [Candidatus Altiarchaeales archaeon IMC4]|nr:MAG: hypothetical protein MSIBF_01370 [Candidatus Altiarchaeales archaeon IMC4]